MVYETTAQIHVFTKIVNVIIANVQAHTCQFFYALAKKEKENKKHNDVITVDLEGEYKYDYNLYTLQGRTQPPITTYVSMSGKNIAFEIDTGAAVSIINKTTFDEHYSDIAKLTHFEDISR